MSSAPTNLLKARLGGLRDAWKHWSLPRKVLSSIGLALLVLALVAAPFWYAAAHAYTKAVEGREAIRRVESSLADLDLAQARTDLEDAQAAFNAAGRDMKVLRWLDGVPYIGEQIDTADRLLASGSITMSAATDLLDIAEELLAVVEETNLLSGEVAGAAPDLASAFKDLTPERKRAFLAVFANAAPRIATAVEKIDTALIAFKGIREDNDTQALADALAPVEERLYMLREGLAAVAPFAATAPSVLGFPDEKTYLLFFQNNTELRPTGGFLGVVGLAKVKDAELIHVDTGDVYALDGPNETVPRQAAPKPITKYMGVKQWYLRDANWSPDFPTAAALMERFYKEEYPHAFPGETAPEIDGIIAITPEIVTDIIRITGPLTAHGVTFTEENFVEQLEYEVEKGFVQRDIPFFDRKSIIDELVDDLVAKLQAFSLAQLLAVVQVVHQNMEEGHILLSMKDPALQRVILENDWGGAVHQTAGDYVHVVDANLASLKSDPAVQRSISYRIEPDGASYVGTVSVTYDHRGGFDWKTTRYRTYTRVFAPLGTEFLGVSGAMENDKLKDPARRPGTADVFEEAGKLAMAAFISIEPKEQRTLSFRFRVAPGVVEQIKAGKYSLYVEKQGGTIAHPLTLDLNFGKNLSSADPGEHPSDFGDTRYRYETDLRVDRTFEVGF